ncbi:cell surface glycoprotein 1 [Drosophila eugracilis]|uniref:cell surface glycoprotein 1 n=1 Tax=Drosophila eugracilis TaxID=29029 RepID=UPI0007E76FD2|nr:cell surface glycoprotein 1 [Drosophila eugracilis]
MRLVWILMSLQLMLLATALSARQCVTPTASPTPTEDPDDPTDDPWDPTDDSSEDPSDSTDEPWNTTSTRGPTEKPSDPIETTTESQSDPTGKHTDEPSTGETSDPTDSTGQPTEDPTGDSSFATEEPTKEPSDQTSGDPLGTTTEGLWSSTVGSESTETSDPSATTQIIPSIDANASCRAHEGVQFLPHPYDCHWYIHCDGDIGFIKDCPSDLYWNSVNQTCDTTCA